VGPEALAAVAASSSTGPAAAVVVGEPGRRSCCGSTGGRAKGAGSHEALATAARVGAGSDPGVGGRRTRLAWLDALRVDHEAAMQENDHEALLRAAEAREAAAAGLDWRRS
jgi:hypothetical protein